MTSSEADPFAGMTISRAQALALRKQLELLAKSGTDPRVREMASDILTNKTDVRGAVLGSRYQDVLNDGARTFSAWYENLSETERAEQERLGRETLEQWQREAVQQSMVRSRRQRDGDDDDWDPPTILQRR